MPDVLSAWIAAGASITAAIVSAGVVYISARRSASDQRKLEASRLEAQLALEELLSKLATVASERTARQAYEYEARKRLYVETEPLLFLFYENAAYALNRIRNLARASRDGDLARWLSDDQYYLASTMHSFLVPLASIHLLREKLTALDFSLDIQIERQYEIGKAINRSYNRAIVFASQPPAIQLNTIGPIGEIGVVTQGVFGGEVQRAVRSVLTGIGGVSKIKSFAEFNDELVDPKSQTCKDVSAFAQPWRAFTPRSKPVFWRILMAQLFLYRAVRLYRNRHASTKEIIELVRLSASEEEEFAFSLSSSDAVEVAAGYRIGLQYLENCLTNRNPFVS